MCYHIRHSNALNHIQSISSSVDQDSSSGKRLVDVSLDKGILPGIRVAQGFDRLPGTSQETFTLGLDTLSKQYEKYQKQGAKLTKWKPAFRIVNDHSPSLAIQVNAELVRCYASIY
ncbi:hypothetical protein GAYE_SCF29G4866 [Galdieria yellowstonensis]|uniref:fructose-bisphosphate aldolase n=1 Tax=Galdieria yellowstonensis TaxID=3028027 RepID=A0AAV9IHK1_9RHOD|nr:hypothetical protein GAYE_SCF29G4866 [Galdieria yellowstonensis]